MFSTESSNLIGLADDLTSAGYRIEKNFTNDNSLRLYETILWNSKFIMNDDYSMDDDGGGGGDDTFNSPLPFDASDGGLWNGRFVPPPPRPPFLDDTIISDGLTTCDLCTWALPEKNAYSIEGSIEAAGDLGFVFMITVVSILSALIGAILMIAIYRCNRLKSANGGQGNGGIGPLLPWWCPTSDINAMRNSRNMPKQRPAESLPIAPVTPTNGSHHHHHQQQQLPMPSPYVTPVHTPMLPTPMSVIPNTTSSVIFPYTNTINQSSPTATITTPTNPQVWIWLKNVNTPMMMTNDVITFPQSTSIENYYTNTDDNISSPSKVSEVVYEEISGIG